MVFLTGNIGAAEMSKEAGPGFGLSAAPKTDKQTRSAALLAARRRFSPEFLNRLDKIVVFRALGATELRAVLELELKALEERFADRTRFLLSLTEDAKDFVLREGTDPRYGARHLKRAIDRGLVHPMSNLIATQQIRGGDLIKVDFDNEANEMTFAKEAEDMPTYAMVQLVESTGVPMTQLSTGAAVEVPKVAARGRRSLAG